MKTLRKLEMVFLRKFASPLVVIVSIYFSTDLLNGFWKLLLFFSLAFFLNWIADKTIVQWSINNGKKKDNTH
jgi:hypothetical protein